MKVLATWTLALALGAFGAAIAAAQGLAPLPARVGVDEHVGATLPLDLTLTDHDGMHRRLRDLLGRDRPVVLALAYYHCPGLCDLSLRELALRLRASGWSLGADYRALTISIDPRDTPTAARTKRASVLGVLGAPGAAAWSFATASPAVLRALTAALGYRYDYDEVSGEYAHPPVSVVVTPEGRLARYLYGPTFEVGDLRLALREARAGRVTPSAWIDRSVLACFRYDARTHRYEWAIVGVMRAGAALSAGALGAAILVFTSWAQAPARAVRRADMHDLYELLRRILFLPPPASSVAREIDALHIALIVTTMLGAGAVGLVAVVFVMRYRRRAPRAPSQARPPAPTPPRWAEVLLITGLFTLFLGWWAVGFAQYVRIAEPPPDTFDVYVSAKQWMWKFAYPSGRRSIDRLVLPAARPVRLLLTSRDVIHSFFVPDFRLKHDVVPGRYATLWLTAERPGRHRVLCAEYCGNDHSHMRAEIVVLAEPEFSRWLQSADSDGALAPEDGQAPQTLADRGLEVAAKHGCLRCHSLDGSPHIGPSWHALYGARVPLADGTDVRADPEYLTESMMSPQAKLHRGYPEVMPSYMGLLQPAEVAALLELIRSLALRTPEVIMPLATPPAGGYPVPELERAP